MFHSRSPFLVPLVAPVLTACQSNVMQSSGIVCPACSASLPAPSLAIQLDMRIRANISRYYLGWTVCDEDDCGARTRMMGVYGRRCLGLVKEGCKGNVRLEVRYDGRFGRESSR
jgi:DNA polymerase alpha subunit A